MQIIRRSRRIYFVCVFEEKSDTFNTISYGRQLKNIKRAVKKACFKTLLQGTDIVIEKHCASFASQ